MIVVHTTIFILVSAQHNPIVLAVSQAGLVVGSWYLLLTFTNRLARWHQSISAIFGTSIILNIISLPLFLGNLNTLPTAANSQPTLTSITLVLIWLWDIAITSRIIRATIEVKTMLSIGISLMLSIAIRFVLLKFFGAL